jgi:uncharacterized RDD family membrane protein YckC
MRPRFQSDDANPGLESVLTDPESYDASEEQFAASLEERGPVAHPKFVVDGSEKETEASRDASKDDMPTTLSTGARREVENVSREGSALDSALCADAHTAAEAERKTDLQTHSGECTALPSPEDSPAGANSSSWRDEVAARVNNYRTRRRPPAPRYPSLQLKFETTQPRWNSRDQADERVASPAATREATAFQPESFAAAPAAKERPSPAPASPSSLGRVAAAVRNIIEFPRPTAPLPALDELAEPVQDRLRIIEAPEIAPPPALGGILIESEEEPESERRPGFEVPLRSASKGGRMAAAFIDGAIVLAGGALFGFVFFKVTMASLAAKQFATTGLPVIALLWLGYQYLLVVHAGTTPGLRLTKLRLSRFDGTAVPQKLRRWRVLASSLSAVSLGLGYLWCFLDEDGLCWHDRITRTHMAPLDLQEISLPTSDPKLPRA